MNAALQKLYKEEKVNPLAGCLPLIIQMPFLISIFTLFVHIPMIRHMKVSSGCLV